MKTEKIKLNNIPAILYGEKTDKLFLYVHGKQGFKEEAESFAAAAVPKGWQVLSFDLPEHGERCNEEYACTAENGAADLGAIYSAVKDSYKSISLYACSLGACFSLIAFKNVSFERCLFVSPVLDMEGLIRNMMLWAGTTEKELEEKGEIETAFGETLSWEYFQYVSKNPADKWDSRTFILYGENDTLTPRSVLDQFAAKFSCDVKIMKDGEHFFHTQEQLEFMSDWISEALA